MSEYLGNIFKSILSHCSSSPFSKWMVLMCDLMVVFLVFLLVVSFGCHTTPFSMIDLVGKFITILLLYLFSFVFAKPYYGIIRHAGLSDVTLILKANLVVYVIYLVMKLCSCFIQDIDFYLLAPFEMLFYVSFVSVMMISERLFVKYFYRDFDLGHSNNTSNVVIYGAGNVGVLVGNALKQQTDSTKSKVIAFLDDNVNITNKSIDGTPVLLANNVLNSSFVDQKEVDTLILALPKISVSRRQEIINKALNLKLRIKVVPKIDSWINDQFSPNMLQNIKIEDLLDRDPIVINENNIVREIDNRVVLVTGAAGSIGSEILRQVIVHNPRQVIALDQSESSIFDLKFELKNSDVYKVFSNRVVFEIADVRDPVVIDRIFAKYHPDIIYHAAAYKHVPLMEENPYEATCTNVFGTKVLSETAMKYKTTKFVMISTDKAVNPTNVMGATKRLAEIFVQSRPSTPTSFVTTRFGNVLGSSGSVVPLFHKQLEMGGPLTVTHKDVFRYFMTIQEAANLVLEASSIGDSGDIFVFDMGKPVRIYDLAENMIRLSKLKNVEIKEIGLRPGEKLSEELLSDKENTIPTEHPKIMHARVVKYEEKYVDQQLDELKNILVTGDDFDIVSKIKEIIPEYISNNSVFSKLDKNRQ